MYSCSFAERLRSISRALRFICTLLLVPHKMLVFGGIDWGSCSFYSATYLQERKKRDGGYICSLLCRTSCLLQITYQYHIYLRYSLVSKTLRQALGHLCYLSHCLHSISCLQGRNRVPEHEATDCFGHQRRQKTSRRSSQPGWLSFLPLTGCKPVVRQWQRGSHSQLTWIIPVSLEQCSETFSS